MPGYAELLSAPPEAPKQVQGNEKMSVSAEPVTGKPFNINLMLSYR